MPKCLLLYWFGAIVAFAQQSPAWVAYSAEYSDTTKDTDSSGRTVLNEEKVGEEIRSGDGSQLTTVTVNGERTTGRLWQGCGQIIRLDYAQKKATVVATSPRRHPYLPPDAPQGTMTIDGLVFTAYPVHSDVGTGTIWINMEEDITAKFEMHLNLPNGEHRDTVHELTSLDLSSPVDSLQMQIPSQFAVEKGKISGGGCLSSASEAKKFASKLVASQCGSWHMTSS